MLRVSFWSLPDSILEFILILEIKIVFFTLKSDYDISTTKESIIVILALMFHSFHTI